jgi:hypothetical protein
MKSEISFLPPSLLVTAETRKKSETSFALRRTKRSEDQDLRALSGFDWSQVIKSDVLQQGKLLAGIALLNARGDALAGNRAVGWSGSRLTRAR